MAVLLGKLNYSVTARVTKKLPLAWKIIDSGSIFLHGLSLWKALGVIHPYEKKWVSSFIVSLATLHLQMDWIQGRLCQCQFGRVFHCVPRHHHYPTETSSEPWTK